MATNTRSRVLVSIAIGTLSLGLTAPAAMAHPGKTPPHGGGNHAQHAQHAQHGLKAKRHAWGHAALHASRVVVSESAGTATVTLRLNKKAPAAASFTWTTVDDRPARRGRATVGRDYTASSGSVTIAAGSRSATVTVPILDDTTAEKKESFAVRFKPTRTTTASAKKAAKREGVRKGWCSGSHGRPTATVVIVDND